MIASIALAIVVAAHAAPVVEDPTTNVDQADAKAVAKAHFDAARAHYDLGRFAEALVEFEKAYAAMPLPALLFNIGQCHFQEKRYGRAVFFYERYLELVPDAPNRATVEDLIIESRRLDAESARLAASPAPANPANPANVSRASPADDTTMWIAVGVGTAAIVAAGIATWAVWTSPPPPGTLGLVDRRTP